MEFKGKRKFFKDIPIRQGRVRHRAGIYRSPLPNIQTAPSASSIIPMPAAINTCVTHLDLVRDSQLLPQQSYVDTHHVWETAVDSIWPFKWKGPYSHANSYRLSKDSFYVLAMRAGLKAQLYVPTREWVGGVAARPIAAVPDLPPLHARGRETADGPGSRYDERLWIADTQSIATSGVSDPDGEVIAGARAGLIEASRNMNIDMEKSVNSKEASEKGPAMDEDPREEKAKVGVDLTDKIQDLLLELSASGTLLHQQRKRGNDI